MTSDLSDETQAVGHWNEGEKCLLGKVDEVSQMHN